MTQQCDALEDKLLDLIYGELPDAEAAGLRAHAETCASCGTSLAKLTSARRIVKALPIEEPRPELTTAILAKVRTAMRPADASHADAPRPRVIEEKRSFWSALAARLGTFLVGPQAAMAAVTVLMVGIGLYYFPRLRSHEPVQGSRTVDPDPTGEAGPSADIAPAAPLDLRYDPHTRRIVDARDVRPAPPVRETTQTATTVADGDGEGREHLAEEQPAPATDETTDLDGVPRDTPAVAAQEGTHGAAGRVVQDGLAQPNADQNVVATLEVAPGASLGGDRIAPAAHATQGQTRAVAADVEVASGERRAPTDDLFRQDSLHGPSAPTTPPQAVVALRPETQRAQEQLAPPPPAVPDVAQAPSAYHRSAPAAPSGGGYAFGLNAGSAGGGGAGSAGGGATSTGSSGGAAASAGSSGSGTGAVARNAPPPSAPGAYQMDVPGPSNATEPLAPVALHHRARAEAASSLSAAIRDYEALLARFPTYPEAGTAMLELADLYRRSGELGRARSLVARAEMSPATRERARVMRVRLDEMDRAARVTTTTSAGAAADVQTAAGATSN